MPIRTKLILAASLITIASSAFAQEATTTPVAGHPRVNEVDQRLTNQQNRTDAGVNSGTINAKQESRDNARDAKVSSEMSADQAKHNGHITKAEDAKMNRQLNRNGGDIKNQKAAPGSATTN